MNTFLSYYLKTYEETCASFSCRNKPSGRKGVKGKFCNNCWKGIYALDFKCVICNDVFTKNTTISKIPKYCSMKCKRRGNYIMFRKRHGFKVKSNNESIDFEKPEKLIDILNKGKHSKQRIAKLMGWKERCVRTNVCSLRKLGYTIHCTNGYYELE